MRTKISQELKAILLIFLTIIILTSIAFKIRCGYAISEFVDDYENEDYIQTKKDVVRNTTLNCMELNISSEYLTNGYFYTKEVLSILNGSSIMLLTNYSSNTGLITVEFSPNNSTWKNHNNQFGSDTLVSGYEAIDLRDLNYKTLYMRFNYTRGDINRTPRLYQIRVVVDSDITINDDYAALLIVGLIMGICIGIVLKR